MQNPQGRIVSVGTDNGGADVVVEVDGTVACARCAAGKGCGAGLLGGGPRDRRVEASLSAGLNVRNGDTVRLVLEPKNLLRAAIVVYGYPLLGAVLAASLAFAADAGDVAGAAAALIGLCAGLLFARLRLRNTRCLRDFIPIVVEKLAVSSD